MGLPGGGCQKCVNATARSRDTAICGRRSGCFAALGLAQQVCSLAGRTPHPHGHRNPRPGGRTDSRHNQSSDTHLAANGILRRAAKGVSE